MEITFCNVWHSGSFSKPDYYWYYYYYYILQSNSIERSQNYIFILRCLFLKKWRRRYFVLYAPPAVDIIPGMCTAILDYYSSKDLHRKQGSIDLTSCEEVLAQLDATFYQNVFGLQTKHKNKDRTYYLAAETEQEMNDWVSALCWVLGMKENCEIFSIILLSQYFMYGINVSTC